MTEPVNAPMNDETQEYDSSGSTTNAEKANTQTGEKNLSGQGGNDAWLSLGLGVDATVSTDSQTGGYGDSGINFNPPPPKIDFNKLIIPTIGALSLFALYKFIKGA